MEKKKIIIKRIVSLILAVFCVISLICAAAFASVKYGVCNEKSADVAFDRSEYLELLKDEIKARCKKIAIPSGIPENITDAFVEENITKEFASVPIENMFLKDESDPDYETAKTRIHEKLVKYAEDFNSELEIKMSEKEYEEVLGTLDDLAEIYMEYIRSSVNLSGIFTKMKTVLALYNKIFPFFEISSLVFAVASFVILCLIHKDRILATFYQIFTSSGLLISLGGFCAYAFIKSKVTGFGLEPNYLKFFLCEELYISLSLFSLIGNVLLTVGIVSGVGLLARYIKGKYDDKKI